MASFPEWYSRISRVSGSGQRLELTFEGKLPPSTEIVDFFNKIFPQYPAHLHQAPAGNKITLKTNAILQGNEVYTGAVYRSVEQANPGVEFSTSMS